MRLAMFGPICHTGGSSAMSLYDVVEEWLRSGHEIDFYSLGSWIDPAGLVAWPRFRYTGVPLASRSAFLDRYVEGVERSAIRPRVARAALVGALSHVRRAAHEAALYAEIEREHARRPYDAFVSMNTTCTSGLGATMPVVSWTQGAPGGEGDFIRRERALVRDECGWTGWAILRGGYLVKDAAEARIHERSSHLIVGSEWSRGLWERAGAPLDRLSVLPFPVNVSRFRATGHAADPNRFVFLWLGRIVPRKRFPLALEAFHKLRARRPGARFVIAGAFGYREIVPKYRLPELGPGVEYLGNVSSDAVPALLESANVIFQPSENENFGSAPIEGLACGIPSVIGPSNGVSEFVRETAFRFEEYTTSDVARAMEAAMDAVLADPLTIARRARALAEETLSTPVVARRAAELVAHTAERWHAARGRTARRANPTEDVSLATPAPAPSARDARP